MYVFFMAPVIDMECHYFKDITFVLALCDADNVDVLQTSWEGAVIDANDVLVLVQYDVTVNGNDEISDGGVDSTGSWGTSPLAACRPRPPHRLPLCAWCGYRMF